MPILLLASNNQGKLREYQEILAGLRWDLVTPEELGADLRVLETGATFRENALLKAVGGSLRRGLPTLADDSGLEVDALGGEPGVRSARYGGEGISDAQRTARLLAQLEGVPWEQRTARFRAVVAIAWPGGRVQWCEGTCEGLIARAPRGTHGFGYDPVFYLPERGQTMAELPPAIKNTISHRAQAGRGVRAILERLRPEGA